MIGNPIEKRRAERFAELLDAAEGGRRSHKRSVHDDELTTLADVGHALRQSAPPEETTGPDPQFQAALRQRLMAVASVQGIGVTAGDKPAEKVEEVRERKPLFGRRRLTVAAALAAGVLGLSGVSTASGDAVPGDTLYPVKRSAERAQLALAGSEVNRGQLHLEFARNRLDEAQYVADDPDALMNALSDMDDDTLQGVRALTSAAVDRQDAVVLDTIDGFAAEQSEELSELMDSLAGESWSAASESMSLLDSATERSDSLRDSLLCAADSVDVETDEFGPLPGTCTALPGTDGKFVDPVPEDSPKASRDERGDEDSNPSDSASKSPKPDDQNSPDPADELPSGGDDSGQDDSGNKEDGLLSELGEALSDLLGKG
ncbi:MAG: DUF5667 domain-containing protein [Stackebrandtia sp.]